MKRRLEDTLPKRRLEDTVPLPAMPGVNDKVWKLGHEIAEILMYYLADISKLPGAKL